jgi:AraC-like DNA-binding protein
MLTRCYRGAPSHSKGVFHSENLLAWHLLKGSVSAGRNEFKIRSSAESWVIVRPGGHFHSFSSDAQILSFTFRLKFDSNVWTGPPVVRLAPVKRLQVAGQHLFQAALKSGLPGSIPPEKFPHVSLEVQAGLQEKIWALMSLLLPLLRHEGLAFEDLPSQDPRLEKSRQAIDNLPLGQPWNRANIAAIAGVSPSQLDRLWQGTRKETPHHYWEQRRLQFARDKLENSNLQIKQVASELGFAHLSQFSNWFRHFSKCPPREFRNKRPF